MTKSVIQALLHRPIAYHATVAKAFGSVKLAILWGQLFYWSDKTNDPEGWVYKTQADWFEETGLSRKEQETARTLGKQLGVLEEQLRGMPATMHFRIRFEKAVSIMEEYVQKKVNHTLFPESPSDGFDAFWEAFPKKTAKAEARKAWNKLNPSDALEKLIIQNVSERANSTHNGSEDTA